MLSSVNSFLGFDRGCIPDRECLVIGQNQEAGGFVLHQVVSAALKEHKPVCLVSFSQKFHHYNSVSQKISTGLQSAIDAKRLQFYDGLEQLSKIYYPEDSGVQDHRDFLRTLKENLLNLLCRLTEQTQRDPVLVIDDVSVLLSMGFHVTEISMFVQELQQNLLGIDSDTPHRKNSSLTVLCSYDDNDKESMSLWKFLVCLCSLDVNITGLQTGYCRDVHGQVV